MHGTPVPALGVPAPVFDGVRRIAVLRGGGLGDLIFAVPAIHSLAAAYPGADITLLGTPLHAALLDGRPGPVSTVEVLPFAEGVRPAPGGVAEDPAAVREFLARMRGNRFDLAVQLHGGGRFSNPFVKELGATHSVGCRTPDAEPLERNLDYVYYQHEVLRALEVVSLAGAPAAMLEPVLETTAAERAAAARFLLDGVKGVVGIHPGATDPRRRWPARHFADVAGRLAADGYQVLVVGDRSDEEAAEEILARVNGAGNPGASLVTSTAGRLDLGGLAGLLARCDVVVGNDSGPRHLAQAVGAATVGVYWFGNVVNAGPLSRARHRLQMSWQSECPVCGVDVTQVGWTAERCEHDDSFVAAIQPGPVYEDAKALLEGLRP
ncbi:glycosyltransferase family 9 protein [Paenarthrobacter sp. DKR-5]|uniref:glycosyltransferase family 9 protein n=1 Tax=Paenarthrobacter sp. DKR-5 TaxID=2835535 RepID=UPI001BDCBEAD|nr:glycosyltransferase family 9 protein [Paenarthrobacter sp. DKR-5]MBT1001515.1 glycosyltransferase family 9 protein [Paenarthrobacter sp. DKR-5]